MISLKSGSISVQVRSPNWDNQHEIDLAFLHKRFMDGSLRTYITGKIGDTFKLSWEALPRDKVIEITTFISTNRNNVLLYTDWIGANYYVVCVTDPQTIINQHLCNSRISLDLEVNT